MFVCLCWYKWEKWSPFIQKYLDSCHNLHYQVILSIIEHFIKVCWVKPSLLTNFYWGCNSWRWQHEYFWIMNSNSSFIPFNWKELRHTDEERQWPETHWQHYKELHQQKKIEGFNWPSQSPDRNPIEQHFTFGRGDLRNMQPNIKCYLLPILFTPKELGGLPPKAPCCKSFITHLNTSKRHWVEVGTNILNPNVFTY